MVRKSLRLLKQRPLVLPPFTKPKSKSGGPSLRRPTLRQNDADAGLRTVRALWQADRQRCGLAQSSRQISYSGYRGANGSCAGRLNLPGKGHDNGNPHSFDRILHLYHRTPLAWQLSLPRSPRSKGGPGRQPRCARVRPVTASDVRRRCPFLKAGFFRLRATAWWSWSDSNQPPKCYGI